MFKDQFRLSLIKLTALYVCILALILIVSSSVIYSAFSNRLDHRFQEFHTPVRVEEPFSLPPSADDVRGDLVNSLVLVNGLLLVVAGAMSYWLARWTLQPLRDSYEKQKRFLSDASHELRTPLTILRTDLENEKNTSHLEEVERMSNLVSNLLVLSRLDEEEKVSDKNNEEINLYDLVTRIVERLHLIAAQHQVELIFEKEGDPIILNSNRDRLNDSLTNIIKNAIIYNKLSGKVKIRAVKEKETVRIMVTDTGIGISEMDLEKVFDRFYRIDPSRSRQTGGSGLGLSIARSSLESLGGKINIESKVDEGTTVTIRLPR